MAQSIVASSMMTKAILTVRNFIWSCRYAKSVPPSASQTPLVAYQQVWRSSLADRFSLRQDDINSTYRRRTLTTPITHGCRISTTATRTTITSRMSTVPGQSADQTDVNHAEFSFEDLVQAYHDCRQHKRNTPTALAFEQNLERNLISLYADLIDGSYIPGKSICFVVTKPKAREVWAADFRDRIAHHLLYNKVAPRFYAAFIHDSCACIPGRGTLYAANRLAAKIRSASQNWSRPTYYLKCDLANFFVSIDKQVLQDQLAKRITEPFWIKLASTILWHDPRQHYDLRGARALMSRVPAHKRLTNQPAHLGLPIGNLSSQFFANVYLDALDQFCKHQIKAKHYIRYVDDFIILHDSTDFLNDALEKISTWLPAKLGARLNTSKTILQPVARGVDFVGHVIKPFHTTTRRRAVGEALRQMQQAKEQDFHTKANSYFGLLRQSSSSHHDRALLARLALCRGFSVDRDLTKTFRKTS
ncbi:MULTISPECIES: RNA-directed DNA polymerase [unclassified Undibacterium]|uniref:RNA-directed DNA polymerase n=1 Tax=unclassified Undibacterium TaxID=2630295 RepID=UPI002B23CAEA|nr:MULTISPECIES: RNA-directed DNA polymerase [unclassified Undibacterium]